MNNIMNMPNIRFAGFAEAWELRKLGEMLETFSFKPFLKEPEADGQYEIIQQGNVPIFGYANGRPCYDYKDVVIFGDHTLSLYKPKRPFFVATDGVRIVKGVNNMNGNYLLSMLEKYRPQSEGYKRYFSILTDSECFITENDSEQKLIGNYFERIDTLIALHQRKSSVPMKTSESPCRNKKHQSKATETPDHNNQASGRVHPAGAPNPTRR